MECFTSLQKCICNRRRVYDINRCTKPIDHIYGPYGKGSEPRSGRTKKGNRLKPIDMTTNRREFIQLSGIGLMAIAAPDFLKPPVETGKHRLAVQLYTIREAIDKDFKGSLKRLADIG